MLVKRDNLDCLLPSIIWYKMGTQIKKKKKICCLLKKSKSITMAVSFYDAPDFIGTNNFAFPFLSATSLVWEFNNYNK